MFQFLKQQTTAAVFLRTAAEGELKIIIPSEIIRRSLLRRQKIINRYQSAGIWFVINNCINESILFYITLLRG